MSAIMSAIDNAADADVLASALSVILDSADQLPDPDQTNAVYTVADIAQSSFEY